MQFSNPQYELVDDDVTEGELVHTGRIVPIYERVGAVTPKMLRRIVHAALARLPDDVEDPLPAGLCRDLDLPGRGDAMRDAHFPDRHESLETLNRFRTAAQRRLIFEEFFVFQLGLALNRQETDAIEKPRTITVDDRLRRAALDVLPFRLTNDQKGALREIVTDLQRPQAMNRLLQGDVVLERRLLRCSPRWSPWRTDSRLPSWHPPSFWRSSTSLTWRVYLRHHDSRC